MTVLQCVYDKNNYTISYKSKEIKEDDIVSKVAIKQNKDLMYKYHKDIRYSCSNYIITLKNGEKLFIY